LIDFYHVCEYLSDAAKAIAPEPAAQKAWMDAQKDALKTGALDKARQALARHFEAAEVDDAQAPVRRCHRYLIGRRNQLNYREALANDLPIGSGEIESAHRYIAHLRLKRPGACWRGPAAAGPDFPIDKEMYSTHFRAAGGQSALCLLSFRPNFGHSRASHA
jgi:hypothetical protein